MGVNLSLCLFQYVWTDLAKYRQLLVRSLLFYTLMCCHGNCLCLLWPCVCVCVYSLSWLYLIFYANVHCERRLNTDMYENHWRQRRKELRGEKTVSLDLALPLSSLSLFTLFFSSFLFWCVEKAQTGSAYCLKLTARTFYYPTCCMDSGTVSFTLDLINSDCSSMTSMNMRNE